MPEDHQVRQGECLQSIASEAGFLWETIWNHPKNAKLKNKRKDPNVLLPGDVVHLPDKQTRDESGGTEQKHSFKVKGTPAKLSLRLIKTKQDDADEAVEQKPEDEWSFTEDEPVTLEDEPRKDVPFHLYVDGQCVKEGKTDGDGRLEAEISPTAHSGELILNPGTSQETSIDLNLRCMDPISEPAGICKRLINLGFPCPMEEGEITPEVQLAIRAFQKQYGLPEHGEADDATKNELVTQHGG